jgi:transposase, IS6 family
MTGRYAKCRTPKRCWVSSVHFSRDKSLESPSRGNSHGGFGGRPHGKGPASQAPRRAAHPSVKVSGRWRYVYRAIDQFGQVIDVYVSPRRDGGAARCFFARALATTKVVPVEVTTDKAAVYPHVLDELAPGAWHCTELSANNRIEADHGQLKQRLRPMRGLKTDHGARIIIAGHAFIQNIRRGHYELGVDEAATLRVAAAFDELALAI